MHELSRRHSARLPELRVHFPGDGRESGDGVDLVDVELSAGVEEEIDARHPGALERPERPQREVPHTLGLRGRELGGDAKGRAALVDVLGRVRVEPVRVGDDDLARHRRDRVVVSEHGTLDLARSSEALLHEDLRVEVERRVHGRRQLGARRCAAHADRRAQVGRLGEDGKPERLGARERGAPVALERGAPERDVRHDRQAGAREQALHHVLVHPDRRAEHAGADVRHARELEEALHGPDFPHRPVENRVDVVDAGPSALAVRVGRLALGHGVNGEGHVRHRSGWRRASRGSRDAPRSSASSCRSHRPSLSMPMRTGS